MSIIFPTTLELVPAYGRSYESIAKAKEAWIKGLDFKVRYGGSYCSVRDIKLIKSDYSKVKVYTDATLLASFNVDL